MDDTRFVREILAQPSALRTAAAFYSSPEGRALLSLAAKTARSKHRIIFTGMGTSLHTPYFIFHDLAGIPPSVEIRDAGELLHFGVDGIRGDDLLVAISQSGESAETRRVVERLKGTIPVIAMVNDPASSMARAADIVLPLHAGPEASISAKTYTNTLAALFLFATALNDRNIERATAALFEAADVMEHRMGAVAEQASRAADHFGDYPFLHAIARRSDLVTAAQLALIVKEGAGIFSEALSGGLFRHGPLEAAGEGHAAVFFLSGENEPELTAALAVEIAAAGSRVLAVADSPGRRMEGAYTVAIECPAPRLFPILCAPFIELFVHEVAKRRGREAGVFRRIEKVTARE